MKKKVMIIFIILAIILVGYYYILNTHNNTKKNNSIINLTSVDEIKLYKLNYNTQEYSEVVLSNTQKDNLRNELKEFEIYDSDSVGVYGKYKLIIDTHEFYFDNIDYNEVYYKNNNKNVAFPIKTLSFLEDDKDRCSCCPKEVTNCNINICECTEE